jgi:hypothetical protein
MALIAKQQLGFVQIISGNLQLKLRAAVWNVGDNHGNKI